MSAISKQGFLDAAAIQTMSKLVGKQVGNAPLDSNLMRAFAEKSYSAAEALWLEREKRRSNDE